RPARLDAGSRIGQRASSWLPARLALVGTAHASAGDPPCHTGGKSGLRLAQLPPLPRRTNYPAGRHRRAARRSGRRATPEQPLLRLVLPEPLRAAAGGPHRIACPGCLDTDALLSP